MRQITFGTLDGSLYDIIKVFMVFSTNILECCCGDRDKLITNKGEPEKMVRKVFLVVALIVLIFSLIGCQTVQGLGEDIKWTGEKGAEILEK